MMPKGVEHRKWVEKCAMEQQVRIPMMPKGVEHTILLALVLVPIVRIPMMPKGVEHWKARTKQWEPYRENSNDAERR